MVDCGAFIGDTIQAILDYTKGQYDEIYAFEPEERNFELMKENLRKYKINYIKKGCWDQDSVLEFSEGTTSSSSVSEVRKCNSYAAVKGHITTVEVTSIDKVLCGKRASFIKMDIEGSEIKALAGAAQTICSYRPSLAICVYHRREDLITIPQFIAGLFPNENPYKYYLRHHSVSLAETVFYAVPR